MKAEKLQKVGLALGALVGSIALVLGMLGLVTVFGYLMCIAAVLTVVALAASVAVRVLQLQVRLVIFYGLVGLVGALLAISLIPRTDRPLWVAVTLLAGAFVGIAWQARNLALYRKLTAPDAPRQEYTDEAGDKHLYIVYGYHELPQPIKERPLNLIYLFLVVWVILIVIGVVLTRNRVVDGATVWASVWAFVAALGLIETFSCWKVERESGVQMFSQFLPLEPNTALGTKVVAVLSKPLAWLGELIRDLWAAFRELYSVAVRS